MGPVWGVAVWWWGEAWPVPPVGPVPVGAGHPTPPSRDLYAEQSGYLLGVEVLSHYRTGRLDVARMQRCGPSAGSVHEKLAVKRSWPR